MPCVGKQQALAMAINSIAYEAVNLAHLLDAQSKMIKYISEMLYGDDRNIGLAINVNRSINSTLAKVIRLHILQELMLEAIADAPTAHTLKGRGVGTVQRKSDYFCGGISIIQAFVCSEPQGSADNHLCYSVHNSARMEVMAAFPESLKMECRATNNAKEVEIKGEGKIISKERFKPDVFDTGAFVLNVCYATGNCSFEMAIKSKGNAGFDHCSGRIEAEYGLLEEDQQDLLLASIALKQYESADAIHKVSENIKSALRSLEGHTDNIGAVIMDINKSAGEALSKIIAQKLSLPLIR